MLIMFSDAELRAIGYYVSDLMLLGTNLHILLTRAGYVITLTTGSGGVGRARGESKNSLGDALERTAQNARSWRSRERAEDEMNKL